MSSISNTPNESSKNKFTKSIAEEMGLKRVQSSEGEKSSATLQPKVKRMNKGLEQVAEPEKQVSDRSIHFSGSSSAMDAYLSKIQMGKQRLGELVNEGGDMAGAIKGYLSEQDLLNLQFLNKTTAERRPSGDELRVVLTEEDIDVSNNNNKLYEKLKFAKENRLKIAIRTSLEYDSQNQGGVIEAFVKFARNNESVLSDIEILEFRNCWASCPVLCPLKDFENVLKQCTNIEKVYCECIPGHGFFTFEGMPKLTYIGVSVGGIVPNYISIKFENLPKLESVYVNTIGDITFIDLPKLSDCTIKDVFSPLRFIGEFPVLMYLRCFSVRGWRRGEIIFPQKLNSLKELLFDYIGGCDCITFPRELNALESITFGEIETYSLRILELPDLPKLKKIEYKVDDTPENIVKKFENLQAQIDARAKEKAKGESS